MGDGTYGVMYGALVAESCRDPGKRKIKGCWHATGTLRNKKKKLEIAMQQKIKQIGIEWITKTENL